MTDCLVRLAALTECPSCLESRDGGIVVRRAMSYEMKEVTQWIENQFGVAWSSECAVAFARSPVSCFLAIDARRIIGFACYEVTQKNFFGPIGVLEKQRSRGTGSRLLLRTLLAMKEMGYGYAIIGNGGQAFEFYHKTAGASLIADSEPGIYPDRLETAL